MDRSDCIMRPPALPIGILLRLQIGFEDGSEYETRCHLHYSIRDPGYAERAHLVAVLLGYPDSPDRFRSVVLLLQLLRQFPKPALLPIRVDVVEFLVGRIGLGFLDAFLQLFRSAL